MPGLGANLALPAVPGNLGGNGMVEVEQPIEMDDLGWFSPYFWKHPYSAIQFFIMHCMFLSHVVFQRPGTRFEGCCPIFEEHNGE